MVSIKYKGGVGNIMFQLAAAISTALSNNVNYIFPAGLSNRGPHPEYSTYYSNILRSIKFVNELPDNWLVYAEPTFHHTPIQYTPGTNLMLDGYFQSEKYFEKHKDYIVDLFKPTKEHKNQILERYPDISEFVSIHIRRGDYLNLLDHHPQMSEEYFKKSAELSGLNKNFLIFSDDIEGCKNMFDFIRNKHYFTTKVDWMDMYTMSMCGSNIICNSTFSWWAAYLNETPDKKVIAPKAWFGPQYSHYQTSDLYPTSWLIL